MKSPLQIVTSPNRHTSKLRIYKQQQEVADRVMALDDLLISM